MKDNTTNGVLCRDRLLAVISGLPQSRYPNDLFRGEIGAIGYVFDSEFLNDLATAH